MVRRILLLSLVVAVVPWMGVVSSVAGTPATSTAFSVVDEPADPVAGGSGSTFFAADDQVDVASRSRRTLILDETRSSPSAEVLSLTGPNGGQFAAGVTYPVATRSDATHASVSVRPLGCVGADSGTLTFTAVRFANATVAAADGSYSVGCASGHASGVFHVRSTTPWSAVVGLGFDRSVNSVPRGSTETVTASFEGVGTTASAARTVVLVGTGAPDANVVSDTCSGQTLAVGATCTVTVTLGLFTIGTRELVVELGDARSPIVYTTYDPATGTFSTPPAPERVMDTRTDTGYQGGRVVAGVPRYLNLDADAVPVWASAVVVNVTAVDPSAPGFLTTGEFDHSVSSLNFVAGQTVANLVTVPTQYNRLLIGTSAGSVDVVVDLVGWYAASEQSGVHGPVGRGGGYHPTVPTRALDTRSWGRGRLAPGARAVVPVHVATDDAHVHAVAVTVTTTDVSAPGYVTAFDATSTLPPATSTVNLVAGATVGNAAIVPVTSCGTGCTTDHAVAIVNRSTAPIDVLVDVTGWYDDGGVPADIHFVPRPSPVRIVDTRTALGATRLGARSSQTLTPAPGVTDYDTVALSTNVTVIAPTAPTYLTVWPSGTTRPTTSLVNPAPGAVVAGHADTAVGTDGGFDVYNQAGQTDVAVDLFGTFERFPATPADEQTSPRPAVILDPVVSGPVAPYPVG